MKPEATQTLLALFRAFEGLVPCRAAYESRMSPTNRCAPRLRARCQAPVQHLHKAIPPCAPSTGASPDQPGPFIDASIKPVAS